MTALSTDQADAQASGETALSQKLLRLLPVLAPCLILIALTPLPTA